MRLIWPAARLSAMKLAFGALAIVVFASVSSSQAVSRVAEPVVFVGTDEENYLRYLQSAGKVGQYPWSLRGFSPAEMDRLQTPKDSSPWSARFQDARSRRRFEAYLLPLDASVRFNSAFPYGSNDGAIWAGRGMTSAIGGGFVLLLGPVTAVITPIAFRAQNSGFALMPTGGGGRLQFADAFAGGIDRPQRFGDASYSRFDPGQSTLRVDLLGVAVGVSGANMGWGPMHSYEYILGANAPGIPHIFFGTSTPRNVWIGKLHGRAIWGVLEQSEYSPVAGTRYYSSTVEPGTRRFATGLIATFEPRGLPGLELGAARFFHVLWPRKGPPRSYFTKVFQSVVKRGLPASPGLTDTQGGAENQLASAFARLVLPKSGFEVYGEYAREDHSYDARDFVQEPDHSRSYGLGFRKVLRADSARLSALRVEMINYQLPTLGRNRGEGGIYVHGAMPQGHTNRGQVLGADTGVGTGAGSTVAWDRYTTRGRTTLSFMRAVKRENGSFFLNGVQNPRSNDVQLSLGAEQVRFLSRVELTTGATLVRELNRNFEADAWNLNALIGVRFHPSK